MSNASIVNNCILSKAIKKTKNRFSRPSISYCRLKVLQNAPMGAFCNAFDFQDRLSLNAGQKYCRKLQWEHSAILLTFIKLPPVIKVLFCLFLSGCLRQVLLYLLFSSRFAISDCLCQYYDVMLTKNHVPTRRETPAVTVVAPAQVDPHQESRLPRRNNPDQFYSRPKPQPTRVGP